MIVGYFVEWGVYGRNYHVYNIPTAQLNVINYAFADISAGGEVALFDSYAAVEKTYPGDTWDQPIRGNFNQLKKLKAQNPHLVTMISVGGWTLSGSTAWILIGNIPVVEVCPRMFRALQIGRISPACSLNSAGN